MDQGSTELNEFQRRLRAGRRSAWVRAVLDPQGASASLLHADVVVGPRPASWREAMWAYPACTFVSARITAKVLASFCATGSVQQVRIGVVDATAELLEGQISWNHIPSLSEYARIALDWPPTVYTAYLTNRGRVNPPFAYLVGQGDVPSFPSFSGAFSAFFYDNFAVTGTQNPELGQITIRFVEDQAWIRRVRVGLTSLHVSLRGRGVRGTCLELNGSDYRTTATVDAAQLVIPLPAGLPSDAWLWLKSGSEWLDYRPLSPWGGRLSPDIQFELPKDPGAEITRLASQGEGAQLEYKEKLPDTRDEKRKVFKTVVAFANGSGGRILFGVEDETHRLTGLQGKLPDLRRRLNDLLRDLVSPSLHAGIDAERVDGRNLLILEVPPCDGTVYALVLDANKPEFYVRRDGSTYFARPEEVSAVVRNGLPQSPATFPWSPPFR